MNKSLKQLEDALQNTELPAAKKEELMALLAQLRHDEPALAPEETSRLQELLLEFESRHPDLSNAIGRLSSLLAGSGL
jgi:hypothetical protein